jgi:chromosome segregation ATPase
VDRRATGFLPNVFSLTLLNDRLPQKSPDKFRHSYQLRDGDDYLDKDCFRIDVVELPKLRERLEEVPERQRIWVRFFLARTYAEVKQLCEEDSIIKRACEVLEMVSKEDEMQDLARMIWQGEFAKRHEELLRQERDHAQAKLIAEGKAKLAEVEAKVVEAEAKVEEAEAKVEEAEAKVEEAEAKVEEAEAKVVDAEAKVIQTLSKAVCALAATGQTPEAIAALLNLPYERVSEILNTDQ